MAWAAMLLLAGRKMIVSEIEISNGALVGVRYGKTRSSMSAQRFCRFVNIHVNNRLNDQRFLRFCAHFEP
jgi:hypothetical protein